MAPLFRPVSLLPTVVLEPGRSGVIASMYMSIRARGSIKIPAEFYVNYTDKCKKSIMQFNVRENGLLFMQTLLVPEEHLSSLYLLSSATY